MDVGGLKWDQDQDLPPPPFGGGREGTNFPVLMHRPTFTNVCWNLNIKKIRAAQGGPLNRGGAHAMALLAY